MSGSLTVVGTGIRVVSQTSPEAVSCIERAQKVFFVAAEALTEHWIRSINSSAESLHYLYAEGKDRRQTYAEMVERILDDVRSGTEVCLVAYGHPGVFASPMHEAVRQARAEGYPAQMLPGVSAEDCLFADLGVDPGSAGCQSFEATDFLVHHRIFDCRSALILWQVGAIGERGYKPESGTWNRQGLKILADTLLQHYGRAHEVVIYEAARYHWCDPIVERVELSLLSKRNITTISTLYVPPRARAQLDADMIRRLNFGARSA